MWNITAQTACAAAVRPGDAHAYSHGNEPQRPTRLKPGSAAQASLIFYNVLTLYHGAELNSLALGTYRNAQATSLTSLVRLFWFSGLVSTGKRNLT